MCIPRIPLMLASGFLSAILLPAQQGSQKVGTPTTGGSTGSTGTGGSTGLGAPTRGTVPSTTPNSTNNPDGLSRGTFFYGKVVMPDGTAPPSQVVIERICGSGTPRPQTYTDSRGNFSFQVGQTQEIMPDATVGRMSPPAGTPQSNTFNAANCELRASLPGYRSGIL